MKLGKDVKAYIDKKLGDTKDENQMQVYQVLIEGYWLGELDINPSTKKVVLVKDPTPRAATPMGAHITSAIMQALAGSNKK